MSAEAPLPQRRKPTCPDCGNTENLTGVEYRGTWEDYDGVSEWQCACGCRWGRWTGKKLIDGELEYRYGR